MKKLHSATLLAALIALPSLSFAGTSVAPAAASAAPASSITGNLGLNFDSKFVSFGSDVWSNQNLLFHPSLELNKAITNDFKLILGTWWDVNDIGTVDPKTESIGHRIREVDVWFGGSYTIDKLTFTGLYQQWMYAGKNEQAIELKIAADVLLKPSLLIHQRLGTGYKEGTVAVLGVQQDFALGPISFSIPAAVSVETSGYHGGDSGVGFGSLGLTASVPAKFISEKATFSAGVTGYMTNSDVIPANAKKNFVNFSTGISIPF